MYATFVHVKSYTSFYFHVGSLPVSIIINLRFRKQTRPAPKDDVGRQRKARARSTRLFARAHSTLATPCRCDAHARVHSQTELDLSEAGFADIQPTKVITAPPVGSQRNITGEITNQEAKRVIEVWRHRMKLTYIQLNRKTSHVYELVHVCYVPTIV